MAVYAIIEGRFSGETFFVPVDRREPGLTGYRIDRTARRGELAALCGLAFIIAAAFLYAWAAMAESATARIVMTIDGDEWIVGAGDDCDAAWQNHYRPAVPANWRTISWRCEAR